ncbi:alkaline phosphatase D family protein [Sandaracinus amylolyticus]|uniref:Phosphodiesterase/alkaline phosphatase D n=1 Tax=Sandaracinus amylolyticus TaxID=927083 RepID=A0A0F6W838_9BACT|nr:alkaline phosphatase D family protein [Sandaracinus amylolyticus]AKF09752.1 Phosphodiesterase/alkaline phosphatase D [Sandaracinus amylolyticus]
MDSSSKGPGFSRRRALKSAGVLGAATMIGCESTDVPLVDASMQMGGDAAMPDTGPRGRDAGPAPMGAFQHGVASGDPLADAVILWTRVTTESTSAIALAWEMSRDASFATIDASGEASADPARDFTAKVDATGLMPATTYYYRFRVVDGGETSPVGRTRTAPASDAEIARLRFAVCSCSNYAFGYFHGYRNIAQRADLDAVLHLGDYIYEYGTGEYGTFRDCDPPGEIVTLDDYRRRYRQYRTDPDLQEAHRQHPFVNVWDDHESADNAWRDGANNHDEAEGAWADRKAAAQQAFDEWLPIRTASEGPSRIWRALRYGALAELVMLDTRIDGRSEQGAGEPGARPLISSEQEAFLIERLTTSDAQWKVIGQQVMFSPLPLLANDDQWDGYPASRTRVLDAIRGDGERDPVRDVVVLTGDIHTAWACEVVEDPSASPLPPASAVEFVAPGISSPPISPPGGPIERALMRSLAARAPHIKYADISHRGYFVLDLSPARVHATFVQIADVEAPYDTSELEVTAWEAASGTSRLVEVEPTSPPDGAPPLAP